MAFSKKNLIFFCLGLDIRVSQIVETHIRNPHIGNNVLEIVIDRVGASGDGLTRL